ncbi:hypothetical protein [Acidovorax sp. JHL-9]|uniref:hypothetical protein n=1 Tax=Acidovorax sp. JHL-9 TaxID=1276756 RepID=UPI0003FBEC74|nr:hypothetical protein [Acidovorax sp. JHL-9]
MIHIRHSLIGLCIAATSAGVLAQGTDEHKAHHPADAAAPAATAAPAPTAVQPSPGRAMGSGDMAGMDRQMQAMQAMHEKMVAAKTPQERQALMAEHMKTMQDGMRMMESMRGQMPAGNPSAGMAGMQGDPKMMEKRMSMMESMMQMMMDRMATPQTSAPGTQ